MSNAKIWTIAAMAGLWMTASQPLAAQSMMDKLCKYNHGVEYKDAAEQWHLGIVTGRKVSGGCIYTIKALATGTEVPKVAEANVRAYVAPAKTKQEWLKAHNKYRTDVKSPALEWSDSLAKTATEYANLMAKNGPSHSCKIDHNLYNYTLAATLGENIGQYLNMDVPAEMVIKSFADEKPLFNSATNSCIGGGVCGHYTQVVSQQSVQVGCGQSSCQSADGMGGTSTTYMYVCNYTPPGNQGPKGGPYKQIIPK